MICLSQFDVKSIIAVSSIVHIGLIIIRIIAFFNIRIIGIYLIIISHGLRSSGLIFTNKGIINFIPRISLYLSRQITSHRTILCRILIHLSKYRSKYEKLSQLTIYNPPSRQKYEIFLNSLLPRPSTKTVPAWAACSNGANGRGARLLAGVRSRTACST